MQQLLPKENKVHEDMKSETTQPPGCKPEGLLVASPYLGDGVNHALIQSEIEGGVNLHDLPHSTVLEIQTENHVYTAIIKRHTKALLWGHPDLCPEPVTVRIHGSTWGGSMLKVAFIGRGMHLEFRHPDYRRAIVTSRIVEIREIEPFPASVVNSWMDEDTDGPDRESRSEKRKGDRQ